MNIIPRITDWGCGLGLCGGIMGAGCYAAATEVMGADRLAAFGLAAGLGAIIGLLAGNGIARGFRPWHSALKMAFLMACAIVGYAALMIEAPAPEHWRLSKQTEDSYSRAFFWKYRHIRSGVPELELDAMMSPCKIGWDGPADRSFIGFPSEAQIHGVPVRQKFYIEMPPHRHPYFFIYALFDKDDRVVGARFVELDW